MRQIGTLDKADDAARFAAYLLTQHIPASADPDENVWMIWVRNEDQVEAAKTALEEFRQSPRDSRYSGVESKAAEIQRAEEERRKQARKNVVEMRGQWRTGPGAMGGSAFKQAPLTCVLIGLCIFVGFLTRLDSKPVTPALRYLNFCEVREAPGVDGVLAPRDGFAQIRQGEVWRLVTPIFLHFGLTHLLFNMFMLYSLGRRVEMRYGAWRVGLIILGIALCSNVAQFYWEDSKLFGGMSGVVYGLLGFTWMKVLYDPRSGLTLDRFTLMLGIIFLFVNMLGEMPPFDQLLSGRVRIANTAHFVGLAAGMLLAVIPLAFRRGA